MEPLIPGEIHLGGTGQRQRDGSKGWHIAMPELQSYVLLIIGRVISLGITPLSPPPIDDQFITLAFPA
ncbi:uncharacterized protein N7529_003457 [Penicillium soppii]|uniref:uncharacterized protein n=1 Tax=Penicillium soppii TaxID=69789 RepID=UPI0025494E31|nr:uncharacterized protein N7529_003457 [Penicillium soppii]KAJ5871104.1 hypothetical protein N7529_003457 [Penicillium soppii]